MPTRMHPARKPAHRRPPIPYCWTIGSNMTTNAAVGPEMFTLEPPVRAITIPATTAV